MTISEVSKKYGISADTQRYYEKIGLIPPVPRNSSGVRDYDESSCQWVEMMKCMRSAGVQIDALVEYVKLFQQGAETAAARKEILIGQRIRLKEQVDKIQDSLERLDRKIEGYEQGTLAAKEQLLSKTI